MCDAGYGGDSCSVAPETKGNGGAVAAGILIPLTLVGAAAVGIWWWKRKYPTRPVTDFVPSWVKNIGSGGNRYSKLSYGAGGSSSSASAMRTASLMGAGSSGGSVAMTTLGGSSGFQSSYGTR